MPTASLTDMVTPLHVQLVRPFCWQHKGIESINKAAWPYPPLSIRHQPRSIPASFEPVNTAGASACMHSKNIRETVGKHTRMTGSPLVHQLNAAAAAGMKRTSYSPAALRCCDESGCSALSGTDSSAKLPLMAKMSKSLRCAEAIGSAAAVACSSCAASPPRA